MRYRFVSNSVTLDELELSLRSLFQNTCVFGANRENVKPKRTALRHRAVSLRQHGFLVIGVMNLFIYRFCKETC